MHRWTPKTTIHKQGWRVVVHGATREPNDHIINWCIQKLRCGNSENSGSIANGQHIRLCTGQTHCRVV